ncbi:MAG: DNA primase [Patescibacteria group bacterium]
MTVKDMDEIEQIKQKINIVDLVAEYIPLKKAGVNFKALCPFHNEKTPSFVVSPERQIFKCFGCQKSGDIFTFLMDKEGMEFKEALEVLAKKGGVTLKVQSDKGKGQRERLFEANLKAQEFFHYILTKHLLGKNALEYIKKRGVKSEYIEKFGIGYAPASWESLTKFLLKRGFKAQEVITAGLAVPSKSSLYDRFRGRIIFPLLDGKDKLRGFSGRVLDSSEPKYINSPQTPIFDKGTYLFGINLAKIAIREEKQAVLVEGEMDVILSHQAGFKNVIASKGTALTQGQVELLKRYTDSILLGFDMDLAGDSASRRGIEIADKGGFNIKVIRLEGGKDAAEVVTADPALMSKAISEAIPIYDYYIESVASRYNLKDPLDLRKIGAELIPVWTKITDDLMRERYIQKLSAFLKMDEKILREAIDKEKKSDKKTYAEVLHQKTGQDNVVTSRSRRELLEEYLIALLLHPPKDFVFVPNFPETILHLFSREVLRQIYVLLVLYLDSISFKGRLFNINEFIEEMPKELSSEVDRFYLVELDEKLTDEKHWIQELNGVILELKRTLIKASLEKLSFEIKNAQEFGKIEVLEVLSKRFRDLSVKLKNL